MGRSLRHEPQKLKNFKIGFFKFIVPFVTNETILDKIFKKHCTWMGQHFPWCKKNTWPFFHYMFQCPSKRLQYTTNVHEDWITRITQKINNNTNWKHMYSCLSRQPFSDKGHLPSHSMEKVNYVRRQMMAELGLSQWRSREFWGMIIMFVLIFFIRLYLHYVGQWMFLQAQVIPITK